jgi:hypothetical protein
MNKFIPGSFERLGGRLYVSQNHPKASDSNPGAEDLPFKTISKAAAVMGPYDEVIIGGGVYREEIALKVNGHHYFPEYIPAFRGREGEDVYIRGSDVFDAEWESLGGGVHRARLPDRLFAPGMFNPFKLSGALDDDGREVRPLPEGSALEETMGMLFVDGEFLRHSVSADGRWISADFGGRGPAGRLIELSVRKRCFKPEFSGAPLINVLNIRVEHAAGPDPYCAFRPESFRRNAKTGVSVSRTLNVPGTTSRQCRLFAGEVGYLSLNRNKLFAKIYDDTEPRRQCLVYDAVSDDAALTWQRVSENYPAPSNSIEDIFPDPDLNILIKTGVEWAKDAVSESGGCAENKGKARVFCCLSSDGGKSWTERKYLDCDMYPYRMIKMSNGEYLLPCGVMDFSIGAHHEKVRVYTGRKTPGESEINWTAAGEIAVSPDESLCGLAEPRALELPDGRIMLLLRMGAVLASDGKPGVPSVKFYSVSSDKGASWSKPGPLRYDGGALLYSPRSYQELFRSKKNGRIYAVMNICDHPTFNCDPRDVLQIAEIDASTLHVKRDSISIIEARYPDTHHMVRFSNWLMFENRETLNPVLLMRQHMCEHCPCRHGYDLSSYRYEINLPE